MGGYTTEDSYTSQTTISYRCIFANSITILLLLIILVLVTPTSFYIVTTIGQICRALYADIYGIVMYVREARVLALGSKVCCSCFQYLSNVGRILVLTS